MSIFNRQRHDREKELEDALLALAKVAHVTMRGAVDLDQLAALNRAWTLLSDRRRFP